MRHTSGPWKWFDYPDGRKLLAGVERAVIHCPDAPMTCKPADAQLIAAAPDMLAALYEVAHHADDECGFMVNVRAAIAKAEGATPPDPPDGAR